MLVTQSFLLVEIYSKSHKFMDPASYLMNLTNRKECVYKSVLKSITLLIKEITRSKTQLQFLFSLRQLKIPI